MKKNEMEKIAERVVEWCTKQYGWSKYYRGKYVLVEVQYQSDMSKKTYGEFDRDEVMIYVYTRTNRTIRCLVNTVIHEFIHYLQSPTWIGRYAMKYGDGVRNPYEMAAETVASRDTSQCMKELGLK